MSAFEVVNSGNLTECEEGSCKEQAQDCSLEEEGVSAWNIKGNTIMLVSGSPSSSCRTLDYAIN